MAWISKPRTRKDGSVYWSVYFREVNHETGRKQQTSISWNDYADAQHCCQLIDQVGSEKAREILRIVQAPRQALTVGQWLGRHIDHLTGVEAGTLARYRAYTKNDFAALTDIPLAALSRDDIARWMQTLRTKTGDVPSGKTVKNKRDFLSGALKDAVKNGHIIMNPCEDIRAPRWDREEMVFLERDEFQLLLAEIPTYWKPLVEFLVSSGCRWSEATALKPSDVDRTASTVRVRRAWKTGAGGYTLGVPKTKMSTRTINVPARVLNQLDYTGEWLFTNSGRGRGKFADGMIRPDPGPVRSHNFNPNVWVPAVQRAQKNGLTKRPRVHDLRHTCASWLIQAGRPLPAVQQQLGHEKIDTTVSVYTHLDRSSGQGNADAIADMLA